MADHDPRPTDQTADTDRTGTDETGADAIRATDPVTEAVILSEPERPMMAGHPLPEEVEVLAALPPEPPIRPEMTQRAETAAPQPVAAPRRSGLVGMVAGGVIAAGLGYGLATVVPDGWPIAGTDELQAQLASQTADITALKAELATLAARPEGIGEDRIAAVEATVQTLQAAPAPAAATPDPRIETLEQRLTALETAPGSDGGVSPAALAAYQAELATLRAELDTQKGAGAAMVTDIEAAAKAAETRLAQAEAQAAALKSEAEATALAATTAAGLARVQAAVDSGAPFAGPLADLATAGLEVPAILTDAADTGLPTIAALQESFPAAARAGLEASLRVDMGDSLTERMGSFLRSQTGARSLAPREGTDPDAVLSRAEAALAANDLPAMLTELAALPPEGQAAMADWVAQAQRRIDATQAVATLATAADAL